MRRWRSGRRRRIPLTFLHWRCVRHLPRSTRPQRFQRYVSAQRTTKSITADWSRLARAIRDRSSRDKIHNRTIDIRFRIEEFRFVLVEVLPWVGSLVFKSFDEFVEGGCEEGAEERADPVDLWGESVVRRDWKGLGGAANPVIGFEGMIYDVGAE